MEQRGVKINNHIINNTTAIIINKSNWLVKFNEYFTLPIYSNRNRNKPQQKKAELSFVYASIMLEMVGKSFNFNWKNSQLQ